MLTLIAVDHIGIATPNIEEGLALYRDTFGMPVLLRELLPDQGVDVALLRCGGQAIELLAPTRDDSAVAKFLLERGAGLHHVAYRVPNIVQALVEARAAGLELVDTQPRVGAGGHLVAFLHPRGTGRVLVELVEHAENAR
jgi:methylmalonyl-CoA/ethylmalonyl-CoA epimerase